MNERMSFIFLGVFGIMAGSQPVKALMSGSADNMPLVIIALTYIVAIFFNLAGVFGFVMAWYAEE